MLCLCLVLAGMGTSGQSSQPVPSDTGISYEGSVTDSARIESIQWVVERMEESVARSDQMVRTAFTIIAAFFGVGAAGGISAYVLAQRTAWRMRSFRSNITALEERHAKASAKEDELRGALDALEASLVDASNVDRGRFSLVTQPLGLAEVADTRLDLQAGNESVRTNACFRLIELTRSQHRIVKAAALSAIIEDGASFPAAVTRAEEILADEAEHLAVRNLASELVNRAADMADE